MYNNIHVEREILIRESDNCDIWFKEVNLIKPIKNISS